MTIQPLGAQFLLPATGTDLSYLTPDALMTYCETRLQGVDTQMNTIFAQQQQMNSEANVLNDILNDPAFKAPDKALDKDSTTARLTQTEECLYAYMAKLNPKDPSDAALLSKLTDLTKKIGDISFKSDGSVKSFTPNQDILNGDGTITPDQFNSEVTGVVSGIQKDLSSGAELNMIQLQAIMSQRQQAISVCTNLVQALGDQANKIADNVGK